MTHHTIHTKPWWRCEEYLRRFVVCGSLLVGLFVMAYLAVLNESATLGLEIRELERSKEQLEQASRRMELTSLKMQSLDYVAESSGALRLEKPDQISYIDAMDNPRSLSVLPVALQP